MSPHRERGQEPAQTGKDPRNSLWAWFLVASWENHPSGPKPLTLLSPRHPWCYSSRQCAGPDGAATLCRNTAVQDHCSSGALHCRSAAAIHQAASPTLTSDAASLKTHFSLSQGVLSKQSHRHYKSHIASLPCQPSVFLPSQVQAPAQDLFAGLFSLVSLSCGSPVALNCSSQHLDAKKQMPNCFTLHTN